MLTCFRGVKEDEIKDNENKKEEQPTKHCDSTIFKFVDIVTDVNDLHSLKQSRDNLTNLSGNSISLRDKQFENEQGSIIRTFDGIVIVDNDLHPIKQ